jgi:serine/threonine protein kinase
MSKTPRVFIKGTLLNFDPNRTVGKGGEGEVFDLGDGRAFKLFKGPDHPDYVGSDEQHVRDREGAKLRLQLMQKKLPAYPKLNDRVVAPLDVVTDSNGAAVGFTMPLMTGAQVLRQLTKQGFRAQAGIDNNAVVRIFLDLHRTVSDLHSKKVQIGDFNLLGILLKSGTPFLIDADSFQFGQFPCRSFTPRFVDPLVCAPGQLVLTGSHSEVTDWYAFSLMLFECLLYVAPYGGVLTGPLAKRVKQDARPLQRLSVFHQDVRYPDKGTPVTSLNDDVLDLFHRLIEKDWRGVFPVQLLERMNWINCTSCGAIHCRTKCPICALVTPGAAVQAPAEERHGKVTITRNFQTTGTILDAVFVNGRLLFLYHEDGTFYREGKVKVMPGKLQSGLVSKICGDATAFASGSTMVLVKPGQTKPDSFAVDSYRGQSPAVATNGTNYFFSSGGRIQRDHSLGMKYLGSSVTGQTMFWAGPKFGFGTYRVGHIRKAFVFDVDSQSLNDSIQLRVLEQSLLVLHGPRRARQDCSPLHSPRSQRQHSRHRRSARLR